MGTEGRYDAAGSDPLEAMPATDPGDSFEEMCWNLLRRRYKPEQLVYVPAEMGGDCGIEGFSVDGIAYQCYADRDSLSLRARTDKQKEKLYADTAKLKKHEVRLAKMLDGVVIEHYFLVVPQFHAAELIEYAALRAEAVRNYNLSFISTGFRIGVKTPKDYPAELRAVLRDGAAKALVPEPDIPDRHIEDFPGEKPDLVRILDEKLAILQQWEPQADIGRLRGSFIRAFLEKEQVLESLRDWPDTLDAVERRRRLRERDLEFESDLMCEVPNMQVKALVHRYKEDLIENVAGIREADATHLAYGQTGEWLMRCPLRFKVPS